MFKKKLIQTLAIAGLSLGAVASAHAIPVTFDLAGGPNSSVTTTSSCLGYCGVSATLDSDLDSVIQTLEVGESFNFDFFTLNLWGFGVGEGTVTASLGFDSPAGSPNAGGTGEGAFGTFFGWVNAGYLMWDDFDPITLADGTSFLVAFDDLGGIGVGSVTVGGTISLLSGPTSVPEPATLGLFGLGLIGLGAARRRKSV